MATLPSLSDLRLSSCGISNFPSLNYVNFTLLVTLDLSYNNFKGSIPDWLGQHKHLQYLDLSGNFFHGSIPQALGNLSSLRVLELAYNHLSGNLPKSLGQLFNLEGLNVGGNPMVGVLSEMNFANLSKLEILQLDSTSFKFDFDPNWIPPFQLRLFSSSNSRLGPDVPAWLYTQRSLYLLGISRSGISTIDDNIFWTFVAGIKTVDISNNSISGDLSNVTLNSSSINLGYNNFTGGLPHMSTNVEEFWASHNSFSSISSLLCHPMSSGENMLYNLVVSYNHLTGVLPDCWVNWKRLTSLDMGSNELSGEVPSSMAALSNLVKLDLRNNNFFGKFSLDLSNWTNLEYLFLDGNKFSGSLPNTMQQDLIVLKLRSNQFIGNIPPQICNLTSLMILDLAENMLSGSMPHCIYNIMVWINRVRLLEIINIVAKGRESEYKDIRLLRSIDLSANNLSGEIPPELFRLIPLWSLNLSRNSLTGRIPKGIGGMKNLESLDLSYNKLFGEIPQTISNLSFLSYLNLSYNSFTGQIPLGTQLQSFNSWSFAANPELCGDPLPKRCKKPEETNNPKVAEGNEDDDFLKSLYLGMGVGFAVGFWGACGSLFLNRAWRHKFFQLLYRLRDRIYVAVALKFKSSS